MLDLQLPGAFVFVMMSSPAFSITKLFVFSAYQGFAAFYAMSNGK